MSYSNGKITAPISASDPYMVMGVGQYNGVYDVAHICGNTHGKINKYAKHKPYIVDKPSELSDEDKTNVNYGMTPKTVSIDGININTNTLWGQWSAPKVNVDWSRLTDFIGYNHNAVPSISKIEMGNSITGTVIPVKKSTVFENTVPFGYNAKVFFNSAADLSIGDFWATKNNFIKNYRLTLVIGSDLSGLDSGYIIYGQSEKTVEEGVKDGYLSLYLPTDTDRFYELMNENINKNIVVLGLAPTISSGSLTEIITLKMYDYVDGFLYQNSRCASYGDGGDGGETPILISYGHMDLKTTTPSTAFELSENTQGIVIRFTRGYPTFSVTSGNVGNGFELDLQLEINVSPSDGSSVGKFSVTSSFTERVTFATNNETETFVDGSPESGILGVILDKSRFPISGTYNFEMRVIARTIAISSGQRIRLDSDGQGNGIQTDFFTKTYDVNFNN